MKFTKILGLFLLVVGLLIIGWSLYFSYNIFTDKVVVPEIFSVPEEEILVQPGQLTVEQMTVEQMTVERMIEVQLREAFPIDADVLPEMLNLTAWSILAFILIFGGSQIAGLGIKLMK